MPSLYVAKTVKQVGPIVLKAAVPTKVEVGRLFLVAFKIERSYDIHTIALEARVDILKAVPYVPISRLHCAL